MAEHLMGRCPNSKAPIMNVRTETILIGINFVGTTRSMFAQDGRKKIPVKTCPNCGSNEVEIFDSDNDICKDCDKWFPAVADEKEIYCHACSAASGGFAAVYHVGPPCGVKDESNS
jgi:hypothetical protein